MTDQVAVTFQEPDKVTIEAFVKAALKEMLVADSDTLHIVGEVLNPDKSITKIKFDLVLLEITTG